MTRKHFTFAADQIVADCYIRGIKKEESILYESYLELFEHFSSTFKKSTFDTYIDNELNEMI